MKFAYTYQDASGANLQGELDAASRDAVYAVLKEKRIRPMRVWPLEAARRPFPWRRVALTAIAVAAVACAYILGRDVSAGSSEKDPPAAVPSVPPARPASASHGLRSNTVAVDLSSRLARPRPRRQVAGLEGVVLSNAFAYASECWLAAYACPGREVPPVSAEDRQRIADDLVDALADEIAILESDPPSVADLKRIVSGMKDEAALFINGGRSALDHLLWIEGRQRMEAEYRRNIAARVRRGEMSPHDAARQLEAMGLREL